ncbi:WYL domain-containing protein [Streptosporangium sp. NPDC051022]|uniref:helix-turn-helix transcriptional regulator n=1 Tax=Streptosporangium sp. NPDC051022 TaxID=3155752 RepID=UPI00341892CE
MNRIDRLYALVDGLRAAAPGARSVRELAAGLGVSARTVERDISALRGCGVPIRAEPGGGGGYVLDESVPPLPLGLTPAEAAAVAVVLGGSEDGPRDAHARSALRKLVAAMPPVEGEPGEAGSGEFAGRSRAAAEPEPYPRVAKVIERSLLHRRVLRIEYEDRKGRRTLREVEPTVFVGGQGGHWYLVGMCRLRRDVRVFRLDRIRRAEETGESSPEHPPGEFSARLPGLFPGDPGSG